MEKLKITGRYFVSTDSSGRTGDFKCVVRGRYVGNSVVIDEVIVTKNKLHAPRDIRMKLVRGTDPPRYEPDE